MIPPESPVRRVEFALWDGNPDVIGRLPYNYLPAAFPAIADRTEKTDYHLFSLAPGGRATAQVEAVVVPANQLRDPAYMAEFMDMASSRLGGPPECTFIGPPLRKPAPETATPKSPPLEETPENGLPDPATIHCVTVVVDGGIAFWDPSFRRNGTSRFWNICLLDFDLDETRSGFAEWLGPRDIERLCTKADDDGSRAVVAELARRYPGSFYGSGGAANPDEAWHGTSVADLAVGRLTPAEDHVAVYGVEIPMSVLQDYDGDNLTAILPLTLEIILKATTEDGLGQKPLVIVLPFGFVSGPQDGSHPVAQAITRILAEAGRPVSLVVPAGNQLQDQCVARIEAAPDKSGATGDRSVIWRLPPDDFSINTADIILEAPSNGPRVLSVTPPGGERTDIPLQPHGFVLVTLGDSLIGAIIRTPDTQTSTRIRFVLAETGWQQPGRLPAPAGDWRLSVADEERAQIFVLRDDRDVEADQGRPRRMSVLVDAQYRESDASGAPILDDDGQSRVRRRGTASLLTTSEGVVSVEALEQFGNQPAPRQAWYSGRRSDGTGFDASFLIDDGWSLRGVECAANGTARRVRMSGTSAAAGLCARGLMAAAVASAVNQDLA